jgi:hypothetical protein
MAEQPLSRQSGSAHRVVIEFDDGIYAKLVCPESGCTPASMCSECGRAIGDPETKPCYDCPSASDECWIKSWFDNCTADELLRGTVTVEIVAEWDGDHLNAHIGRPIPEESHAGS